MRIVVTGREGQIARSLVEVGTKCGHDVLPIARPEFDLTSSPEAIASAIRHAKPDVIVSAAAYTAVDKAESERDLAFKVNAIGAGAIARAATLLEVPLIHLSTDYVFSGRKQQPYVERDPTNPSTVYGASKLAGERLVLEACANAAVLRTAWVYSPYGSNFVKTMMQLAHDRDEVSVVADQVGNPTSSDDAASAILRIGQNLAGSRDQALRGIFHMAGSNEGTWADFAAAIFEECAVRGLARCRVRHITTADFPTPARRPANSRLNCARLFNRHGVHLPNWRKSLKKVVASIARGENHSERIL